MKLGARNVIKGKAKKERSGVGYYHRGSILPEGYNARRLRKCRRRKRFLKGESHDRSTR